MDVGAGGARSTEPVTTEPVGRQAVGKVSG